MCTFWTFGDSLLKCCATFCHLEISNVSRWRCSSACPTVVWCTPDSSWAVRSVSAVTAKWLQDAQNSGYRRWLMSISTKRLKVITCVLISGHYARNRIAGQDDAEDAVSIILSTWNLLCLLLTHWAVWMCFSRVSPCFIPPISDFISGDSQNSKHYVMLIYFFSSDI